MCRMCSVWPAFNMSQVQASLRGAMLLTLLHRDGNSMMHCLHGPYLHTQCLLHGVMGCKVVSRQCKRPSWCCLNVLDSMCNMCKSPTSLRICTVWPQLASLSLELTHLPLHAHVCNTSQRFPNASKHLQSNWPSPLTCQAMPLSVINTCILEVSYCPTPPNWYSSPFNI